MTGKRIFAWQTDTAGCFLYRLYWPLTTLPMDQFEVAWGAPPPDIHDYDIVVGQRLTGDNDGWLRLCADPGILAVYDLDDYLLGVDPENEPIYNIYAPQVPGTERNIAAADLVTVSTQNLADAIDDLNPNVVVLPNCLPSSWIKTISLSRPPVVGWGGSMFHGNDFEGIAEQIYAFKQRRPGATVVTYGHNYLPSLANYSRAWTTMEHYMATMDFNIGIAPVRKTPFNAMKSHCKVLEYASRGIPAVATNWGQYPEFIVDGVNGFLVDNMDEWPDALETLCDEDTRLHLGLAAQQQARRYTIEKKIHLWVNAYNKGSA